MTADAPKLIALEQVSMQFGSQRVLHGIELEVQRGQTLAVIGESGCGKTVLLKLIIGLLRPTVGRSLFDGRQVADLPERELVKQRLRFGFLFQGAALFDSLSVFDNVAFGLRAQGAAPTPRRPRSSASGCSRSACRPTRSARSPPSCPAACANGSVWPAPWPSTPK